MTPATVTQGRLKNDCGLFGVTAGEFGLGHACVVIRSPQLEFKNAEIKSRAVSRLTANCKPTFLQVLIGVICGQTVAHVADQSPGCPILPRFWEAWVFRERTRSRQWHRPDPPIVLQRTRKHGAPGEWEASWFCNSESRIFPVFRMFKNAGELIVNKHHNSISREQLLNNEAIDSSSNGSGEHAN